MANAGRVSLVPKGEYVAGTKYTRLDLVKYIDDLFVAKKDNVDITPSEGEYWMNAYHSMDTDFETRIEALENEVDPVIQLTEPDIEEWFE